MYTQLKPDNLVDHPEGGRFKEVFRSARIVTADSGRSERSALTHIYFSLRPGEVSKFHKVSSDEVWNLYQGTGIRLYSWDGVNSKVEVITLSAQMETFCHVIPAGIWQAAEPLEDTVLVGCSVAPGFEFEDFKMINPTSSEAEGLVGIDQDLARFV